MIWEIKSNIFKKLEIFYINKKYIIRSNIAIDSAHN